MNEENILLECTIDDLGPIKKHIEELIIISINMLEKRGAKEFNRKIIFETLANRLMADRDLYHLAIDLIERKYNGARTLDE